MSNDVVLQIGFPQNRPLRFRFPPQTAPIDVADLIQAVKASGRFGDKLADTPEDDILLASSEGPLQPRQSLAQFVNSEDVLTVIVNDRVVGPAPATKRFRSNWLEETAPHVLEYKRENPTFMIETSYSLYSGLVQHVLLLRNLERFQKQFDFLLSILHDRRVEGQGYPYATGWIIGPPGVGKSTAAFAFALTMERPKWVVTWIHLTPMLHPYCVQFKDGTKRSRQVLYDEFNQLNNVLEDAPNQNHILFLDGFQSTGHMHKDISAACHLWLGEDFEHRRLVIITSMSARGKTNDNDDSFHNVKVYNAQSWTLDELVKAVEDTEFFNGIKKNLNASVYDSIGRQMAPRELVESKFYFAGGSSRFMFDYTTETVLEKIKDSIEEVGDVMPYIQRTMGVKSSSVVNRLFTVNRNSNGERIVGIISQFAATSLAGKIGPRLIKELSQVLRRDGNPAMDGWLLEMWFFGCLRHTGVTYRYDGKEYKWPRSDIEVIDPDNIQAIPQKAIWWKPRKWNQGGYDAVFVDPDEHLVRFVQVTTAKRHGFKIQYFHKLLDELKTFWEVKRLEIFFLYKEGDMLQISGVTGSGLLTPFGEEWGKGKETDAVTRCTINWDEIN